MRSTHSPGEPAGPHLDIEDAQQLLAYLRQKAMIPAQETPQMETLAGGVSNRTVQVTRTDGQAWVIKQALAKLRVPVDWYSSPQRVHREALGLRWLNRLTRPGQTPTFVAEDFEAHLLIMEAVAQPHENWKVQLLRGEVDVDLVRQFGRLLAAIHCKAAQCQTELEPLFGDRTFFESLRLEPYYGYAAQQTPPARAFLHKLIQETRSRTLTLVHGDYSPKNILVRQGQLVLLDHEVIHWGDPAFDLGFSMTHLLSKAHHVQGRRAQFMEAANAYWRTYAADLPAATWRQGLEEYAIRHTLACLLARVAGRSPLEYLTDPERQGQQQAVLALMGHPPTTMAGLIEGFGKEIDSQKPAVPCQ